MDLGENWKRVWLQHGSEAAPYSFGTRVVGSSWGICTRSFLPQSFPVLLPCRRLEKSNIPLLPAPQSLCFNPLPNSRSEWFCVFMLFHSWYLRLLVGLGSKREWRDPFIKCFLVFAATLALHSWHSSAICSVVFSESPVLKEAFRWYYRVCVFCFF